MLFVAATPAESAAVVAGALQAAGLPSAVGARGGTAPGHPHWQGVTPAGEVAVLTGGIGPAAAAAATATALAARDLPDRPGYDLVVCVGIAGGFPPAAPGSVVAASHIVHADLGAESAEGFLSGASLGWATSTSCPHWATVLVADRAAAAGLTVHVGPVATVSTVTGTAAGAARLAGAGVVAEAMEGAGAAAAAAIHDVPVLEVRGVSNPVGPRDRAAWRVADALEGLTRTVAAMLAQPWPDPGPETVTP